MMFPPRGSISSVLVGARQLLAAPVTVPCIHHYRPSRPSVSPAAKSVVSANTTTNDVLTSSRRLLVIGAQPVFNVMPMAVGPAAFAFSLPLRSKYAAANGLALVRYSPLSTRFSSPREGASDPIPEESEVFIRSSSSHPHGRSITSFVSISLPKPAPAPLPQPEHALVPTVISAPERRPLHVCHHTFIMIARKVAVSRQSLDPQSVMTTRHAQGQYPNPRAALNAVTIDTLDLCFFDHASELPTVKLVSVPGLNRPLVSSTSYQLEHGLIIPANPEEIWTAVSLDVEKQPEEGESDVVRLPSMTDKLHVKQGEATNAAGSQPQMHQAATFVQMRAAAKRATRKAKNPGNWRRAAHAHVKPSDSAPNTAIALPPAVVQTTQPKPSRNPHTALRKPCGPHPSPISHGRTPLSIISTPVHWMPPKTPEDIPCPSIHIYNASAVFYDTPPRVQWDRGHDHYPPSGDPGLSPTSIGIPFCHPDPFYISVPCRSSTHH